MPADRIATVLLRLSIDAGGRWSESEVNIDCGTFDSPEIRFGSSEVHLGPVILHLELLMIQQTNPAPSVERKEPNLRVLAGFANCRSDFGHSILLGLIATYRPASCDLGPFGTKSTALRDQKFDADASYW